MDPRIQPWQNSLSVGYEYFVAEFSAYLPRLIAAFVVLVVGFILAKIVQKTVLKVLDALRLSRMVSKTPLEVFLQNAELGQQLEGIVAALCSWIIIFITIHSTVTILGLTTISRLMESVFEYIPHLLSALVIFVAGVLLAGVVETVVKGVLKSFDPRSSRLFAKVASYLVVTVASLAAVAELGIASQFILILFTGVVAAFSLAAGLAFGLGGADTVKKMLSEWRAK